MKELWEQYSKMEITASDGKHYQTQFYFICFFNSLNRTSDLKVQGTHVRESKKKFGISFWILLT